MGGQDDFASAIEALMAERRDELGKAPTPEELLAYRDGLLDPQARQRIEESLAAHPDAARALADLAAFPHVEPAPGAPEVSAAEVAARWQSFRQQLPARPPAGERPAEKPAAEPVAAARPQRPWPRRESRRFQLAAALLLTLAGGGAGFLIGRNQAPAPDWALNAVFAELPPREEGGTRAAATPVALPAEAEELVLILGSPSEQTFPGYEVEITGPSRGKRSILSGLRRTRLGSFHLSLRRSRLETGSYQLRLFGRDGRQRALLGTYELELSAGPTAR